MILRKQQLMGFLFLLTFCSLFTLSSCQSKSTKVKETTSSKTSFDILDEENEKFIEMYNSEVNQIASAVVSKITTTINYQLIPGRYLFTTGMEFVNREKKVNDYKNIRINQYNVKKDKIIKQYDVEELLNQEENEYIFTASSPIVFKLKGTGQHILTLDIKSKEDQYDVAVFDLKTGKIKIEPESFSVNYDRPSSVEKAKYQIFSPEYDAFKINNSFTNVLATFLRFKVTVQLNKTIKVSIDGDELPEESVGLYKMFPMLKKHVGDKSKRIEVTFADLIEPETIMTLFTEDGTDIVFKDFVIAESDSIDGQAHKITSFAEFNQWIKPKE